MKTQHQIQIRTLKRVSLMLSLLALPLAGLYLLARSASSTPPTGHVAQARAEAAYGKLPLSFEANQGQTDKAVKFLSRTASHSLLLTSTEAVIALSQPANKQSATVRMKLAGANQQPRISGLEPLPGKSHYFLGDDPKQWHTDVPTYAKVKYEGVYPGVDAVFYGNQQQLEYDFIVAPGANPKQIKLNFAGAERMRLDEQGDLLLETAAGEVRQHRPVMYQEVNGNKQEIAGRYVRSGEREVGFEIGAYDTSQPLVIDPVLIYSTKISETLGVSISSSQAIAVDSSGCAYITGFTFAPAFPTTLNAVKTKISGGTAGSAIFVTKLSADGRQLIYSALIGGNDNDSGQGIAVNAAGEAFITGVARSSNFPTTPSAFRRVNDTTKQAVVMKLSADGSQLLYSTCLGGLSEGRAIAINQIGNAYVTGLTQSTFPTTPDAFQRTGDAANSEDVFLAQLSADGSRLVYATLLGSGTDDYGSDIALDGAENVYLTGFTTNGATNVNTAHLRVPLPTPAAFPTTAGAFQTAEAATVPAPNIFVAKFNQTGGLVYSSLVATGIQNLEDPRLAVDAQGQVYVSGSTRSALLSTTPGVLQPTSGSDDLNHPIRNALIMKLSADGSRLLYATYLGGQDGGTDSADVAVDSLGYAYVIGTTSAVTFPVSTGTIKPNAAYAFITKLNPDGTGVIYSAFMGQGQSVALALDASGQAYVTGRPFAPTAGSTEILFPTTEGAFNSSQNGTPFVVKVANTLVPEALQPTLPLSQNPNSTTPYGIGGRIKDEHGQGVAGVTIKITAAGLSNNWLASQDVISNWSADADGSITRTVTASANGWYGLDVPPGGNYVVTPSKDGCIFSPASYTVKNLGRNQSASFVALSADGVLLNPSFESNGANWTASGEVSYARGLFVTDGRQAAKLSPASIFSASSVLQWVKLTPGGTYELSADIATSGSVRATLGVKWDNTKEGPGIGSSVRRTAVRFIVPDGVTQVGIYCKVTGSMSKENWAAVDNVKLVRVN